MALTASENRLLQETHDGVIAITASCESCNETVRKHDKVLYGDGRGRGLITRVHVIWGLAIGIVGVASLAGMLYGVSVAIGK